MRGFLKIVLVVGLIPFSSLAAETVHFNPDTDPSRIEWLQVSSALGRAPSVRGERFGIVIKNHTNEYWRMMTAGYRKRAAADGVKVDIQAAQNEADPIHQLDLMQNMIGGRYKAILISPQSSSNLQPAIDDAISANLPLVDIDGAVVDSVTHFVGPMNYELGVEVANWFIGHYPVGGKVAVIEGLAGLFSTVQRTSGFRETLLPTKRFDIVASVSGNWDRQQAFDAAVAILHGTPDLIGIYCNNDTMALGVVEAVKSLHRLDQVRVFGTDGTWAAYTSIKAGELTGTVDIFPMLTGEIGLDIAQRLSGGQTIPRVVATPHALITRDNIAAYEGSRDTLPALPGGKATGN